MDSTKATKEDLCNRMASHTREQHEVLGGDRASDCLICEASAALRAKDAEIERLQAELKAQACYHCGRLKNNCDRCRG